MSMAIRSAVFIEAPVVGSVRTHYLVAQRVLVVIDNN
jgi:hypothetical protein